MFDKDLLVIKNPRVVWSNFAGTEGPYNAQGHRWFIVVVPREDVDEALSRGFRVKEYMNEGVLKVSLAEGGFPTLWGFDPLDTIKIYPKLWTWKPGLIEYSGVSAILSAITEEN